MNLFLQAGALCVCVPTVTLNGGFFFINKRSRLNCWDTRGRTGGKVLWKDLWLFPEIPSAFGGYVPNKNNTWRGTVVTLWCSGKILLIRNTSPLSGSLCCHKAPKTHLTECCTERLSKNSLYSTVNTSAVARGYRKHSWAPYRNFWLRVQEARLYVGVR